MEDFDSSPRSGLSIAPSSPGFSYFGISISFWWSSKDCVGLFEVVEVLHVEAPWTSVREKLGWHDSTQSYTGHVFLGMARICENEGLDPLSQHPKNFVQDNQTPCQRWNVAQGMSAHHMTQRGYNFLTAQSPIFGCGNIEEYLQCQAQMNSNRLVKWSNTLSLSAFLKAA